VSDLPPLPPLLPSQPPAVDPGVDPTDNPANPLLSSSPALPTATTSPAVAREPIEAAAALPINWPTTLPPLNRTPPSMPASTTAEAAPRPDRLPVTDSLALAEEDDEADPPGRALDPGLAWIVVVAATIIGLSGLAPDVRYTALWTTLLTVGVLAILFDRLEVEIPTASDMAWGIGYGLLLGIPLVVIALPQLQRISQQAFVGMSNAYIFQALVLIMPASDALFFRGALQPTRGLFFTVGAASLWSILIFFPQLQVLAFPLVAVVIAFAFVILNFLYSYLKRRFGLFASWTCQITINLLLLFVVRFLV